MLIHTTAAEQKWIVRIILKGMKLFFNQLLIVPAELKVGLSEKSVLNYFHPDALELFNVTSNLRL